MGFELVIGFIELSYIYLMAAHTHAHPPRTNLPTVTSSLLLLGSGSRLRTADIPLPLDFSTLPMPPLQKL
jgi:hypothetical protein